MSSGCNCFSDMRDLVSMHDFHCCSKILQKVSSLGIGTFSSLRRTAISNLKDSTVGESISYTGETIREQSTSLNFLQLALGTFSL